MRRQRTTTTAMAVAGAILVGCTGGDDLPPADPVERVGEGLTDLGPAFAGIFDEEGGRTDLDPEACHAWVEVLPAGVGVGDRQQYLVAFGLRGDRQPAQQPDDGEQPDEVTEAEPVEVVDEVCVAEREAALERLARRLAVTHGNLTPSLVDEKGTRWFLS